jgi:TIGR03009 family protein
MKLSRLPLALGVAALLLLDVPLACAQRPGVAGERPVMPIARPSDVAPPAAGDVPQSAGEVRPKAEPLVLPDLPPVPMAVLVSWADKTKDIAKLDGSVKRVEYDEVFQVEKHSTGKLYYAKPNKGRIELEGLVFPEGKQGNRFNLAPGDTEEWVCDGQRVIQINRPKAEKPQANVFAIPDDQQGENIMNGPLPFLFGMPPDVAQKRFWLFLKTHDAKTAHIVAYPKLAVNAQSYKYAEIILSKETFLPVAVKLRSPADNGSVMYVFEDVVQNRRWQLANPFAVNLDGMNIVNKVEVREPTKVGKPAGPPPMPSLVGLSGNDVKLLCERLKVDVKFYQGEPAANENLKFRCYRQMPAQDEPLVPGTVVKVVLYVAPEK